MLRQSFELAGSNGRANVRANNLLDALEDFHERKGEVCWRSQHRDEGTPHLYEAIVQFYRDVVGLKLIESHPPSIGFEFGGNQLWIDRVPGLSQAEIWLELITHDVSAASDHLKSANVVRCDEIEPLPEGLQAFWISNPASIIHLVCKDA